LQDGFYKIGYVKCNVIAYKQLPDLKEIGC